MPDEFDKRVPELNSPASHLAAITPSDSTDLTFTSRAIYVGVGGTVAVVTTKGEVVNLSNTAAGSILPIRAKRVNATTTTASGLVSLW
jgi:hypothetical protein